MRKSYVAKQSCVGDALREARVSQRRTRTEVAPRAKMSVGYLTDVELNTRYCSTEDLKDLCEVLQLDVYISLVERKK